jgi:hypothetical protein
MMTYAHAAMEEYDTSTAQTKITAIGCHTQDWIQSHTKKHQTTPPRNNQEGKQRR